MKICIISNFYPPFFFGGERAIQHEAEALTQKGHEITVITSSPTMRYYTEVINKVEIFRIMPFNLYPPYEFQNKPALIKPLYHLLDIWNPITHWTIRKALRNINPQVVYVHNFKGLSLAVFSAVKSLGLSSIFCVNDYSLICPRATLLRSSTKICDNPPFPCRVYALAHKSILGMNQPGLVVSVAQFTLDRLKSAGFFSNTDNMREVVGVEVKKAIVKTADTEFGILFVGGVNKHKGVHVIIKAFTRLKQRNIRLHIVGKGGDMDEMKRFAAPDPRITFHGFIPDEDLSALRQRVKIAVVPSMWYDMAQGVICESFSNGIPVIGSRIGGIPEFIIDGYNGYLFEPGNDEALAEIVSRLTQDTDELEKLSQGAFESSKQYNLVDHIDRLEEILSGFVK